MGAKYSSQIGAFHNPMSANNVNALNANIGKFCSRFWTSVIFWTKCTNLAVECDWDNEISQNEGNLSFFFEKVDEFFQKKNIELFRNRSVANFLKNAYQMVIFFKISFPFYSWGFWLKIKKI